MNYSISFIFYYLLILINAFLIIVESKIIKIKGEEKLNYEHNIETQ